MCGIVFCYTGPHEEFEDVYRPFRSFVAPAFGLLTPMPFPVLQGLFDPLYPPGLQQYWRGENFLELTDPAIATHTEWRARFLHSFRAVQRVLKWAQVIPAADEDANNRVR